MKHVLLSLACRLHALLFSYMTRAGLILCDVDPQMIANELGASAAISSSSRPVKKRSSATPSRRSASFRRECWKSSRSRRVPGAVG